MSPGTKKKIAIIAGSVAAVALIAVAAVLYSRGDHQGPSIRLREAISVSYGERIGLYDIVRAVSDESAYTIAITSGGEVAEDGRSTLLGQVGVIEVEITATDEYGNTTVQVAEVTVVDDTPPRIQAESRTIEVGDDTDFLSGVTAEDEVDGDLTAQLRVDQSQVDTTRAGTYPLIYTVTDSAGNEAILPVALTVVSPEARQITLSQQALTLEGNGHYQLAANVSPSAWSGSIEWTSSDESVAVVFDGLITWVGPGSCTITATADGQSAECRVTCGYVTASSIRLNQSMLELEYGQSEQLLATVIPSNWSGEITWSSSDPEVATVEDGVVTAVGDGTCTITATAEGRTASCYVTCTMPELESLTLPESEISLKVGESVTITPDLTPEDWPGELVWTSSNPSVATVTQDGKITAVSVGNCDITVTAGDLTATVNVDCWRSLLDDLFGFGDGNDDTNDDEPEPDDEEDPDDEEEPDGDVE